LEPLLRPALNGGDESKIQALGASPLETDVKMLTQQAAFTLHVTDRPLDELPGRDEWRLKLVIPAQSVPTFGLALDVLGFRLADIFPDLFSLAQEIKNSHKPARPR